MKKKKPKTKIGKEVGKEEKLLSIILPESARHWIFGVLMFLVATIISLSFFNLAGAAGRAFTRAFTFLIGKAIFVLPLLFVIGGLAFIQSPFETWKKKRFRGGSVLIGIFILTFGIAGFIECLTTEVRGGGWIGYFATWPFLKVFGELVSQIIFLSIIAIGGLILWHFLGRPKPKVEGKPVTEKPSAIKRIFGPKFKVKEIEDKPKEALAEKEAFSPKPTSDFQIKTKPVGLSEKTSSQLPPTNLLEVDRGFPTAGDIKINSAIIKRTLQNFDIQVEMSEINIGPTVTQYTLKPAEGIKLSKITALSNDLSLALAAHPIRIEAPIPGRPLVGVEVPNRGRAWVRLRNLIEHQNFQNSTSNLSIALGRNVAGLPVFSDLSRMPHLLVAGSTGTGKTICLNSIILSFLYQNSSETLRFILVDPKRVEFTVYNDIPHLLCPVIHNPQKAVNALKWLMGEMERRFEVFSAEKARDIANHNEMMVHQGGPIMPYIILIIDELADLMAARGREIEAGIVRLAQMARAVGIHLIVATQRPSVEVITGLIKANVTSRITFQVASQVDSRTVLDMAGAEKLLGLGDMLFVSAEIAKPKRIQGAYVSEKEVRKVIKFIKDQASKIEAGVIDQDSEELVNDLEKSLKEDKGPDSFLDEEDPLFQEAKKVVIEAKKASASLLQRRLRIGYARAARLIDILEEKGVVGPGEGAKPREVYGGKENEG